LSLSYYLIEHGYFNVHDLSNYTGTINYLPSKTIIKMLDSLTYVKSHNGLLKKIIELGSLINENLSNCDENYHSQCK